MAAVLRRIGGDISRGTLAATVIRLGVAVQPFIPRGRISYFGGSDDETVNMQRTGDTPS
jgi:hypothetical protein